MLSPEQLHQLPAPSKWKLISEPARAALDLGKYLRHQQLLNEVNEGDGHPVMVLPGFLTNDYSTCILRNFIAKCGYASEPWKMGLNLGQYEDPKIFYTRIKDIRDRFKQKISLVGWSLGGVYAREIARHFPQYIRQVITLGSPFAGIQDSNNVAWIYELLSGKTVAEINREAIKDIMDPPPVPSTALYSKNDGVVSWQHCCEQKTDELTQNIEVKSSHWGMGHSIPVLYCIADRLSQDVDNWKLFSPEADKKGWYPNLQ